MNFVAYYNGTGIEHVSHPKDLPAAKRYFKQRYGSTCKLVVLPVDATKEEHAAAAAASIVASAGG